MSPPFGSSAGSSAAVVEAGASSAPTVRDRHRSPTTPAGSERWLHLGVAGLCLGLVAVAALLPPVAPGGGDGLAVAGYRLPELCSLKATTGIPCPGCGLTRSWVSAVHGDLAGSAAHHPLGWLVLLYALAQGVRHAAWLALPGRRSGVERIGARLDRGIVVLGALLFLAWIPRLVLIFHQTV